MAAERLEPGSCPCVSRAFLHRKIWNAIRISELMLKSTFSGLRSGKRGKDTQHHLLSDEIAFRVRHGLRFNRFRFFPPNSVAYLRTIECTHSRQKRERYDPQIASGWSRRRRTFVRCIVDNLLPLRIFHYYMQKRSLYFILHVVAYFSIVKGK